MIATPAFLNFIFLILYSNELTSIEVVSKKTDENLMKIDNEPTWTLSIFPNIINDKTVVL